MNAPSKIEAVTMRTPFAPHQISKLPKETKAQIDARKADRNAMVFNCEVCGGHHHKNAVHLDYVGHAALTDRLLDVDEYWSWEPVAFNADGLPAFDRTGGLWIRLTVNGVTRLGYGAADGKSGGDAVKEIIGDALRNAAMRFGAALDLWHKGDLHLDDEAEGREGQSNGTVSPPADMPDSEWAKLVQLIEASKADRRAMLDFFRVPDLRKLNQDQYGKAVEMLNEKLTKLAKQSTDKSLAEALDDEIAF
jgi:hypothetical protein